MPSKAKEVLSAAEHRYRTRHDDRLDGVPEVDLDRVERKDDHVHDFAEHRRGHVHDLAERENGEFVRDTARFVDDLVIEVGDRRCVGGDPRDPAL